MPLNSEPLPSHSREEFCCALKKARERNGITLDEIEKATKIPAFMFAALEQCDLRRWPHGLFRRSFFRDYVKMIGVPAADACATFVRLFVDDEASDPETPVEGLRAPAAAAKAPGDTPASGVRLMLDAAWHGPRPPMLSRLLAAVLDAGAVVAVAIAIAWLAGLDRSTTLALVALAYLSLATAVFAESPAKWVLARRRSIIGVLAQGPAAVTVASQHAVASLRHMFDRGDQGKPSEPVVEERPVREWTTDARRVGPAPSARFRVRIKLPQ